jgi:hypothetical protein
MLNEGLASDVPVHAAAHASATVQFFLRGARERAAPMKRGLPEVIGGSDVRAIEEVSHDSSVEGLGAV